MLSPDMKEKTRHGEHFFPLQRYITELKEGYTMVMPHWHEEAELTRILDGSCIYQIELQSFIVQSGDFLFIPPGVLHSITVRPGTKMRSETFVFHFHFLGSMAADVCSIRYLAPVANHQLLPPFLFTKEHPFHKSANQIMKKISSSYVQKNPGYELLIKAALLELIAGLIPYCNQSELPSSYHYEQMQKLKTVLSYLEEHFSESISIRQMADLCFYSPYHFMRFFKKYTGMSCLEYVKKKRLEQAALLLKQGISPTEASSCSGFENLSYFYREFKKYYNLTPGEYQKLT